MVGIEVELEDSTVIGPSRRMRLRGGVDKGGILSVRGLTDGSVDSRGILIKGKSMVGIKVGDWAIKVGFYDSQYWS